MPPVTADIGDPGSVGALDLDGARAEVETARVVGEHLGFHPLAGTLADLPHERRVLGVHAGSAGDRGVDLDAQDQPGEVLVKAEVEGGTFIGIFLL